MASITAVTVAGNLTRDPEIRYTREGQATTSLSGQGHQGVGGVGLVPRRRLLEGPGRERRPQPDQGQPGAHLRPPGAAELGDRRR
jgi:hypothetical protein